MGSARAVSDAVRRKGAFLQEALRLLPDTIRLLRRLPTDATLPRGARIGLSLRFTTWRCPYLIPDFIPLIGYADDVIMDHLWQP